MEDDLLERAKVFATVIAEASRGLPGIDARFFGFTHNTIYDAGDATRPAIHALETRCCKNEAAVLCHVAEEALSSKRAGRLLVMISHPDREAEVVESLRSLAARLARQRVHCAHVAVEPLTERCFLHNTELLDSGIEACTHWFGRICLGVTGAAPSR